MLQNRFDVSKYTEDGTGLLFALIEKVAGQTIYHIGLISIDGLQAGDANFVGTTAFDADEAPDDNDLFSTMRKIANTLGVGLDEDEVSYCLGRMVSVDENR
ncbi:hypothetical protein [Marinobacter nauticus]|nr:hypothetical protein [Marinobacter nauticus]